MELDLSNLADHDIYELLKRQDADAWMFVWKRAVLTEARSFRNSEMARKWGVSPE